MTVKLEEEQKHGQPAGPWPANASDHGVPLPKRKEEGTLLSNTEMRQKVADDRGGEVIKGTLDLLILRTLEAGAMHGWEITVGIEQASDNLLSVNQGSLYPALYRMVRRRLVTSEWRLTENNRRARYYTLVGAGRKELTASRHQWARLSRGVNLVLGTS